MSFPRLQRIDHRFKWVEDGASRRNSRLEDLSGLKQAASVIYKPWHKIRVALYIACIRADAAVDPDLTRIHPNAGPVAKKQSHCTSDLIGWSVAKSPAQAAMPTVGPVVLATTRNKQPRKRDFFGDWSKQPVEENQVPHTDQVSCWSCGMSNDVDSNSQPDSALQGDNKMNSSRSNPCEKRQDIAPAS